MIQISRWSYIDDFTGGFKSIWCHIPIESGVLLAHIEKNFDKNVNLFSIKKLYWTWVFLPINGALYSVKVFSCKNYQNNIRKSNHNVIMPVNYVFAKTLQLQLFAWLVYCRQTLRCLKVSIGNTGEHIKRYVIRIAAWDYDVRW